MSFVGPGRPWRELPTLGDLLVRVVAEHPGSAAGMVTPDGRATWAQVLTGAERVAEGLLGLGLGPGARIALVGDNSVEGVQALFACAFIGAVPVLVNTRYAVPEVRHVLADAAVDAVLVTGHPDLAQLVRDTLPGLAAAADPAALRLAEVPSLRVAAAIGFAGGGFAAVDSRPGPDPAATARRIGRLREQVTLRQTALMVYTSGTTARARGCPLSHEAVVGVSVGVGRDRFRCTAADVLWDVLPLFHLSFVLPLLAVLDAGGTFVTDRRFDAVRSLAQIRDEAVTIAFSCFPTVINALLDQPTFGDAFARVRLMLNVGPPETLRSIQARAPGTVQLTSYGCSEVGGIGATTGPDDSDEIRLGTNGFPLPGLQMAAIDPLTQAVLPPGEPGEVVVRGIGLFEGYWHDPGKTAASMTPDGWFRTGDLGFVDAAGRVSYRGRLKETIKVGGENVAPMEIEAVLGTHPAVGTVAVVGVADPRLTEVPAAFVELRPGAVVSADELLAHCRSALADFKVPRHVRFVTQWPMSATKIRKDELARGLAAELEVPPDPR